ncbi:zinc-binding dehydrogenase [Silvibacterium sp.]|uniref:zinc-binding dehydrogenase n=1 Tax=Silvibacterium sp. TaxID=1964179 RepID=UPI0039E36748
MDMKTWAWQGAPEPTDLKLIKKQLPSPKGEDVLIANKAVALNPVDWKALVWKALGWQPGHVPGVDGAGVAVACGPDARVPIGTRVAYHQDLQRDGSFATHTLVAAKALHPVPEEVSFLDTATVPCPGLTAWHAVNKIPVADGADLLIIGGGAAVGTFLVQLALKRGYRVWTTASPKHHAALFQSGVAGVFDYRTPAWQDELLKALKGERLYAAIDTVNEAHARSLAPLIGYNGHLVCIQDRLNTPAAPAFSTVISQHEVALGAIYRHGAGRDWEELHKASAELLRGIASGTMKAPAVSTIRFDELPHALATLKSGGQSGKLIAEL